MKCLVLAGGSGERLWPLSRRDNPKQFIELIGSHSAFRDTIARNLPFCDEFFVSASADHKHIIEDQLRAFQGLMYRCFYEQVPRRTAASVALSMMSVQPSEYVLVVPSDTIIEASDAYSEAIIEAKGKASEGKLVVFGKEDESIDRRYGYIYSDKIRFKEKPEDGSLIEPPFYRNLGMLLVRAGDFLDEFSKICPSEFKACRTAWRHRVEKDGDILFTEEYLAKIERLSVERGILEHTRKLFMVKSSFSWDELTSVEDIEKFEYKNKGPAVALDSEGTLVVNNSPSKAVVVSGIKDAVVVNTDDAVFVGARGRDGAEAVKKFLGSSGADARRVDKFINGSNLHFRQWGYYIDLESSHGHFVRHNYLNPGKTIYEHSHESRTENWIILSGRARILIGTRTIDVEGSFTLEIKPRQIHRISNTGDSVLEFMSIASGDDILGDDRQRQMSDDIGELQLGAKAEPILKLRPALKEYLWGGSRLKSEFGIKTDMEKVAEAWVLSAHPDGQTRVMNGRHKGMYLGRYIDTAGKEILGWKCSPLMRFPLLVKFIDAEDDLSIQVHPDDEYALENEQSYGKNEMWYVLDSKAGAGLYVGFKKDVKKEQVKAAVNDGSITDLLNFVPTKKGDVFFIPAGTVHAIGKGNLICEVQQSSNCTYRIYDFDRIDRYGNKRELNLDKALQVIDYSAYEPSYPGSDGNLICRCKYFEALVYDVDGELEIIRDDSKFEAAVCLEGEGSLICADTAMPVAKGESAFIPASDLPLKLHGRMKILLCHI